MRYPSDDYLSELGRITFAFSQLENRLATLLELILDPSNKCGAIVASHLSFQRLLDTISSIYAHRWPDAELNKKIEEAFKRASLAEQKRNLAAHSHYVLSEDTELHTLIRWKTTAKRKEGLKHRKEEISVEHLYGVADEIERSAEEVTELILASMAFEPIRATLQKNA